MYTNIKAQGCSDPRAVSTSSRKKVDVACLRCRRQKLKCDIQRPCTLCIRADAVCLDSESNTWKPYQAKALEKRPGRKQDTRTQHSSKRARHAKTFDKCTVNREQSASNDTPQMAVHDSEPEVLGGDSQWKSSSTINLIEEAFQYHSSNTPPPTETSAYSGFSKTPNECSTLPKSNIPRPRTNAIRFTSPAARDLFMLLPEREPANLLLNTYFDRVHWFTLVFYQDEFRSSFENLYDCRDNTNQSTPNEFLGFTSTLLAAFAVAIQHAGGYRKNLMRQHNVEPDTFKDNILLTLKSRLIDILSLGSLEAVQTCVLLGSYYVYHGRPELAWPICGCGLRIAQALNLHRKMHAESTGISESERLLYQRDQERKRTWWAVYEIETICSMLYGYPLSITDKDCDVELLDAGYDVKNGGNSDQKETLSNLRKATLLSYKHFMSRLSLIISSAVKNLYDGRFESFQDENPQESKNSNLRYVIQKVNELEHKLQEWQADLPIELRLSELASSSANYEELSDIDRDIGASGQRFEAHLFQFQALSLKLAAENTRILIHRPLLSYKLTKQVSKGESQPLTSGSTITPDPFQHSLLKCRSAALQSSQIGKSGIFSFAPTTYAAAFFGMHLFTAGITLCIMASLQPLSIEAHEAKVGVHEIMKMQSSLEETSILAAQGLNILKELTALILKQETQRMFQFPALSSSNQSRFTTSEPAATNQSRAPNHLQTQKDSTDNSVLVARFEDKVDSTFELSTDQPLPFFESEGSGVFDFDFEENQDITRALQDIEQVMAERSSDQSAEDVNNFGSGFGYDNDFIEQEQGWIWGFDFFQNE